MRFRLIVVMTCGLWGCASQPLPPPSPAAKATPTAEHPPGTVWGKAVTVAHYCAGGGAAVDPREVAAAERRTPMTGLKFEVIAGAQIEPGPVVARFTTDGEGKFELRLPPGAYCFYPAGTTVAEPRTGLAAPGGPSPQNGWVDQACLEAEARRCSAVVTVTGATPLQADIERWETCPQQFNQPCYQGPMPP